jgi:uncharacterized membrane protein
MKRLWAPGAVRRTYHALSWTERAQFAAGLLIVAGLTVEGILLWLAAPDLARALAAGVVTEIFTGREGGIPVALAGGVPPLLVIQVSIAQDLAAAFLVFPFFLHALHIYHGHDSFLMRRLRRIEAVAQRHKNYVHRWGPAGVFLFMLVPFLVNGPLVGLMLGRVAGIPTRFLLGPVAASTAVAAFAWTYFYDVMFAAANILEPGIARWIAVAVAGILGMMVLWDALLERKQKAARDEEE